MHASATEPTSSRTLWRHARIRGLFAGLGYTLSFASVLVTSWTIEAQAQALVDLPELSVVVRLARTLLGNAVAVLPVVPLLVVAVNLAPRGRFSRIAWLSVPIVLLALWLTPIWLTSPRDTRWFIAIIERIAATVALTIVCLYHNSVRGAAEALLRERIDNASLDAALARSRLQLLRSQIEPHFLFNTLANVRTLARGDPLAGAEMLGNLMLYLKAALPKMRQESYPLAQERDLVEAYLSIHQVRMGRRLSYEIKIPKELERVRVPTMMLLTLVENAVKHGISPLLEGGFIAVSAARRDSMLLLTVADSGRGMPARDMQGTGTGVANIRTRLMMQYGAAASIALSRARPRGVVAAISMPIALTP